jgi:tetratricopeptide (TPR) repeat protein
MAQMLALPVRERRTPAWAKALAGMAVFYAHQDALADARAKAEESLAIRREWGDLAGIAASCHRVGRIARDQNDYETARALLQEGLALRRRLGEGALIAETLCELGWVLRDLEEDAAARRCFGESLKLAREVGNDRILILALDFAAVQSYLDGDFPSARRQYEEAMEIARRSNYPVNYHGALLMLGEVARCEGDYDRAAVLYQQCLSFWPTIGAHGTLAGTLVYLGCAELRRGHRSEAERLLVEGLRMHRELDSRRDMVIALVGLAGVARARGEPERAARLLGAVEALCETQGIRFWSAARAEQEREIAAVRAALSEEALATAWAEGRSLSLEEAVAAALDAVR